MAEDDKTAPVDVRVVELPAAFTTLLQTLADRLTAMETREAELRQTIAHLQDRIDDLEDGGGMLMGAGAPVTNPLAGPVDADDKDTSEVDAGEFVQALGEQILAGSDESSDFTIDNVQIELLAGLGKRGDRAQLATNARKQAVSQNASKISFSVRRRTPTQIIE